MTTAQSSRMRAADDSRAGAPADREIDVIGVDGSKDGSIALPGAIFDVQVNIPLIHQVVVAQLAAARQGTSSTKSRGEVRGGGRKPYRQKGTGRARQGSIRAPQFVGGGVVHGPTPRSYDQRTPKKMKAAALRGALSDRARNGRLHVVSALLEGDVPSTQAAVSALTNVSERRHVLVVVPREDVVTWKSLRNAPSVHLLVPQQLNTYDVLVSDDVVFTRNALEEFLAGPTRGRSAVATSASSDGAPQAVTLTKDETPPSSSTGEAVVTSDEAAVDEAAGSEGSPT